MKRKVLTILFAFLNLQIWSQDIDQNKFNYSLLDGSQSEMNIAAKKEFIRSDNKLNEFYNEIKLTYKDKIDLLNSFKLAQTAWIQYRDLHIIMLFPEPTVQAGSAYSMCYYIEKSSITWERVKHLKKMLENTEGDVCNSFKFQ